MVGHGLAALNLFRTHAFLRNLEIPCLHFAECIKARGCVSKIDQLTTGEAWGWKSEKDPLSGRIVSWKREDFNGYKLGSTISLLISDFCDVLKFVDRQLDLVKISTIASKIGRIPLFGRIVLLPLDRFQNTFGMVGFIFTIADTSFEAAKYGLTTARVLKLAENVLKITYVTLFAASIGNTIVMYTFYALIASSTAAFFNVARTLFPNIDHPLPSSPPPPSRLDVRRPLYYV
jgi:hypothetical protein